MEKVNWLPYLALFVLKFQLRVQEHLKYQKVLQAEKELFQISNQY